jgi:hypothetical protein
MWRNVKGLHISWFKIWDVFFRLILYLAPNIQNQTWKNQSNRWYPHARPIKGGRFLAGNQLKKWGKFFNRRTKIFCSTGMVPLKLHTQGQKLVFKTKRQWQTSKCLSKIRFLLKFSAVYNFAGLQHPNLMLTSAGKLSTKLRLLQSAVSLTPSITGLVFLQFSILLPKK